MNEKKLSAWIHAMYRELVAQGMPHPAVQGMLAVTLAQIYCMVGLEDRVKTEVIFSTIVKNLDKEKK